MNEQENTRLVQKAYQSIQSGDISSLVTVMAPDILWEMPKIDNVPFSGTWRGHEQVKKFFSLVFEVQEVVEFEPKEFIAQGDKVVVLGRFLMRVKATGRDSRSDWAHVWTVNAGKVVHMQEYVDSAAVGKAHAITPNSKE
jgi:uncharacterized protein